MIEGRGTASYSLRENFRIGEAFGTGVAFISLAETIQSIRGTQKRRIPHTPVRHEAADAESAPMPLAMPCLVPRHGGDANGAEIEVGDLSTRGMRSLIVHCWRKPKSRDPGDSF
nr:NADH dehydrogenase [ubiquinone] iron-sulfur protein 2 [Ipomoea batatas]